MARVTAEIGHIDQAITLYTETIRMASEAEGENNFLLASTFTSLAPTPIHSISIASTMMPRLVHIPFILSLFISILCLATQPHAAAAAKNNVPPPAAESSTTITTTTSIHGRLSLPDPSASLNSTRLTLNDGSTHNTYTQPDGSFVFYRVPPGVHLLDVQSREHHFSQVKIQLLEEAMDSPKCIEYVYPGAPKQAIPHPLELTAHASYQYYEPRQGFSIFSILKNPMLLMMIVSVGGMMFMPKMMEGLDPEQKEQMQKQMAMQQDPSKMLTSLFKDITGTGEEPEVPQIEKKPSSKAGGKTARRGKRD